MIAKPAKLKISFVIDAPLLGDFIHQYADRVQGLDIVSLQGVAWNKNKPRADKNAASDNKLPRAEGLSRAKAARVEILALLKRKPTTTKEICDKLSAYPRKFVWGLIHRMKTERGLARDKAGVYRIAGAKPKRERPPGGFNFERKAIRDKAIRKALESKVAPKKAAAKSANGTALHPTEGN